MDSLENLKDLISLDVVAMIYLTALLHYFLGKMIVNAKFFTNVITGLCISAAAITITASIFAGLSRPLAISALFLGICLCIKEAKFKQLHQKNNCLCADYINTTNDILDNSPAVCI